MGLLAKLHQKVIEIPCNAYGYMQIFSISRSSKKPSEPATISSSMRSTVSTLHLPDFGEQLEIQLADGVTNYSAPIDLSNFFIESQRGNNSKAVALKRRRLTTDTPVAIRVAIHNPPATTPRIVSLDRRDRWSINKTT